MGKLFTYFYCRFSSFFENFSERSIFLRNIFRFDSNVFIVTAAIPDEHGIFAMPNYDKKSAESLMPFLKGLGINAILDHCKGDDSPKGHSKDMIILCGPVYNDYSIEINQSLKSEKSSYNGFYFSNFESNRNKFKDKESDWQISHKVINEISLSFQGLPRDNATIDFGLIYVGPNPINKSR